MITDRFCKFGLFSPSGEYYGDDHCLLYLVDNIVQDGEKSKMKWLEDNGWAWHSDNIICISHEINLTDAQLNKMFEILSGEYIMLDFNNKNKLIFVNELLDTCSLKKKLTE